MPRSGSFPALSVLVSRDRSENSHRCSRSQRVETRWGFWGPERGTGEEGKPGASGWRMELENAEDSFSAAKPFCSASQLRKLQAPWLALKQRFAPAGFCCCWRANALMRSFQNILSLTDFCSVPASAFLTVSQVASLSW